MTVQFVSSTLWNALLPSSPTGEDDKPVVETPADDNPPPKENSLSRSTMPNVVKIRGSRSKYGFGPVYVLRLFAKDVWEAMNDSKPTSKP